MISLSSRTRAPGNHRCAGRALILIKHSYGAFVFRGAIIRPETRPASAELVVAVEPGNDVRPDVAMRLPPDENAKMLQNDAGFARIFDDLRVRYWHGVDARFDRGQRRDLISRVDDDKRGNG
jgi:hypothetical protein